MGLKQTPLLNDHFDGGHNLNQGQKQANRKNLSTILQDIQNQLNKAVQVYKFNYDFAVDGGGTGTIALREDGENVAATPIPDNSIMVYAYVDILTAIVSTGNNGTIALQLNSAGDILAAVDGDSLGANIVEGLPLTGPTLTKTTAARTVSLVISVNNFTAGKFDVYVHTVQGS